MVKLEFNWNTCDLGYRAPEHDKDKTKPGQVAYVTKSGRVFFEYPWNMEDAQ